MFKLLVAATICVFAYTKSYASIGSAIAKHPFLVGGLSALAIGGCGYTLYKRANYMSYAYDVICGNFTAITVSKSDTIKTLKQVVEHNAVWDEFCGDEVSEDENGKPIGVQP